jgi:uncharacterized protein (TIGR04141 family)
MARPPRQQKLTFSLLKPDVTPDDALRDAGALSAHVVPALTADAPSLFVTSRAPHPPTWLAFIEPHVRGDLPALLAASSSAVLFIEASDRLFALTFGQGRHLLSAETVVSDFGLKVVLNTVAPDQLKSVDAKTIDETTMHTRRDVSRDSSFSAFGLDVSRDLLRAVTGTPQDATFGPRLTGSDALGLYTRAPVPELPQLAERLLTTYHLDDYKANFDFIDFLRQEKRPERLRELEERLVEALQQRDIVDVHLAAPETLDWLDVDGFRFTSQDDEQPSANDPRITEYLDSRDGDEITLETLKTDKMAALRASDGEPQGTWPILRCIVYQTELGDDLYVLSAGDWFRVNMNFKDRVYNEVAQIRLLEGLPAADQGTDEDSYNLKAAAAIDALCLDKKFVYDGGPDKMEVCDILTRDGGFIHVKHRGSSSTLSHLFTQGLNSAERLLQDPDFRRKAREVVAAEDEAFADVFTEDRPSPESHQITFVVITRSDRDTPLTLPFFSVVSLRAAASRLRGYGFPVSVAAVREQDL